eukprot:297180_1
MFTCIAIIIMPSSRAHQGRDLQHAKTWPERRIEQYPNESFTVKSGKLYCQCCGRYIDAIKSSTVKRHLGLDAKQAANTNNGDKHKTKLQKWLNPNENDDNNIHEDFSQIKYVWIKYSMCNGLNASQTAGMAKDFFGEMKVENSSTIPTYVSGVTDQWTRIYQTARDKIKGSIDLNKPYSFLIDETPDRWDDLSVTNLLYTVDPREAPITLEISLRTVSQDNEGVLDIAYTARDQYDLNRDNCSAIALDSTNYNVTFVERAKYFFRLAVPVFDMIHIFANGIKYNYLLDEWIGVKTYFIKSRSTFLNSLERKKSLKEYLKYDCDEIQDNGDLEHVFKQLLSNEVEDLLNQPLRREFADEKEEINYKENVIKALKKEISLV